MRDRLYQQMANVATSLKKLDHCAVQTQQSTALKTKFFRQFNFDKKPVGQAKYTMPLCHFDSYNLWMLKPTHLNRGRGIHVFRDLDSLYKLIKQYCSGREIPETKKAKEAAPDEGKEREGGEGTPAPVKKQANRVKFNTFIIQKYIERPLLIHKRKFDIRVWVLLSQEADVFFFEEGYLRTSGSEFCVNLKNVDDAFVHLTNNAVQKKSETYGAFEDGNQLNFAQFQDYIDLHYPGAGVSVKGDLVPQMKEIVVKTFNAVRKQLDPAKRKHTFELFGYDFILDEDFNQWLIEVNTNPCLEESSQLLKTLLPRMVEDMLKLTVDHLFPKS